MTTPIKNDDRLDQSLIAELMDIYHQAQSKRQPWENLWQDCYDYALPQRGGFSNASTLGSAKTNHIFDATALDASD